MAKQGEGVVASNYRASPPITSDELSVILSNLSLSGTISHFEIDAQADDIDRPGCGTGGRIAAIRDADIRRWFYIWQRVASCYENMVVPYEVSLGPGFEYSHVMRIRPDFVYLDPLPSIAELVEDSNGVYIPIHGPEELDLASDIFWVTKRRNARATFLLIEDMCADVERTLQVHNTGWGHERLLKMYWEKNNLTMRRSRRIMHAHANFWTGLACAWCVPERRKRCEAFNDEYMSSLATIRSASMPQAWGACDRAALPSTWH